MNANVKKKRNQKKGSKWPLLLVFMRYHHKKPNTYLSKYGSVYTCNHPVYDKCTLYKIGDNGLAVIQQRFDCNTKHTWWSEIDPWLTDTLYLHPRFEEVFDERSKPSEDGLYPTITIRQFMWALRMKPIPRENWETYFDRKHI